MILDTCVLFDAVVIGRRTRTIRRLMIESEWLSAPALIRVELAGALTRAVRRKELSREDALSAYQSAEELLPETEADLPLIPRALQLSLELFHPCPDCVFLALAERRTTPLITADARFVRKLDGTSYARLVHLIES